MIIFQSLGGLGLFLLFGMEIMSEGLQRIAGNRMRKILAMVSNNRLVGCGVGDRLHRSNMPHCCQPCRCIYMLGIPWYSP